MKSNIILTLPQEAGGGRFTKSAEPGGNVSPIHHIKARAARRSDHLEEPSY